MARAKAATMSPDDRARLIANLKANQQVEVDFQAICEGRAAAGCAIHASMAAEGLKAIARFDALIAEALK